MLLPLLAIGLSHASSEKVTEITAPLATTNASADGFIAEGEWNDAMPFAVGTKKNYGYLYVKHNYTVLWVFLDHVSDKVASPKGWDNGWVAIDKNMDGGDAPKVDDLLFHGSGHHIFIGDGVGPIEGSQWGILFHSWELPPSEYQDLANLISPFYAGGGQASFGPTDASNTPHRFFEVQIPLNWLEGATVFGFAASMQDDDAKPTKNIIDWPETQSDGTFWPGPDYPEGNYMPPSAWGKLTLGTQPIEPNPPLPSIAGEQTEIPYLYIIIAAVVVVVVVSAVVLVMRRRKKPAP